MRPFQDRLRRRRGEGGSEAAVWLPHYDDDYYYCHYYFTRRMCPGRPASDKEDDDVDTQDENAVARGERAKADGGGRRLAG